MCFYGPHVLSVVLLLWFMLWKFCKKQKLIKVVFITLTYTSCGLKQRPASCKKHWYLQALFQHDKGTVFLTLFDDKLKKILGFESITQDELDDMFLSLPDVHLSCNNKVKIVLNIEKQQ